jgi:hypothetical protein
LTAGFAGKDLANSGTTVEVNKNVVLQKIKISLGMYLIFVHDSDLV